MQNSNQRAVDYIDEIISGRKEKYELLIRMYNERLYRVAKGILWQEDSIEDAMQETYIKAYKNLASFQKRSSFSTWITRILINECLALQKEENKRKDLGIRNTDEIEQITNRMNPEKKVVNKELKALLENAVGSLPEKYRLVFIMRELENISVSEVKETLEITETNVKTRLSRAKEMLRTQLMSQYPLNELLDFNLVRCDRIVKFVMGKI
jgi:RNA polymerase sigma factor (sigma-70 family)